MNIARFAVSHELLVDALRMPEGTAIREIRWHPVYLGAFEIVIIHNDLPEVQWGAPIPEITPQLTEMQWDWNVK